MLFSERQCIDLISNVHYGDIFVVPDEGQYPVDIAIVRVGVIEYTSSQTCGQNGDEYSHVGFSLSNPSSSALRRTSSIVPDRRRCCAASSIVLPLCRAAIRSRMYISVQGEPS